MASNTAAVGASVHIDVMLERIRKGFRPPNLREHLESCWDTEPGRRIMINGKPVVMKLYSPDNTPDHL